MSVVEPLSDRAVRSGDWFDARHAIDLARRAGIGPSSALDVVGLRLVRRAP